MTDVAAQSIAEKGCYYGHVNCSFFILKPLFSSSNLMNTDGENVRAEPYTRGLTPLGHIIHWLGNKASNPLIRNRVYELR